MEKISRRIVKRWSDYTQDHYELGGALNGFYLNEGGTLATPLEKAGTASDATSGASQKLVCLSI